MAGEETSAGSDAIVVGEDWISEHYFTTDATKESFRARVLARRKEWEAQKGEAETPRSRLTAARVELLDRFSTLDLAAADVKATVSEINGALTEMLGFRRLGLDHKIDGPVTFIRSAGLTDTTPLALVDAVPGDGMEALLAKNADNLVVPFEVDDKTTVTSVARLLSTLFTSAEHKPAFVLVLAGPHVLVAERERWPEGRYLTIDLQLVCERNETKQGGELDRALDLPVRGVVGTRRPGRHLVDGDPRRVGQAHGRGQQGPARGSSALHRDHRQRGRPATQDAGTRATARGGGAASGEAVAAGSSTGFSSCSTPRRRPSWECCRQVRPSTTAATASTGCAS